MNSNIDLKDIAKQVWAAKTADEKRAILAENLTEAYIVSLNVGYRNDFYSNHPTKLDTLISNIILKSEKLGVTNSKFRK